MRNRLQPAFDDLMNMNTFSNESIRHLKGMKAKYLACGMGNDFCLFVDSKSSKHCDV
jgi:hypothetical protein